MIWQSHWNRGLRIDEFIASLSTRKAEYDESMASFEPEAESLDDVKVWREHAFRIGIITEEWCGDAANYLPPFLKLFQTAPGLDVRIFIRDEYPDLRDANLSGGKAKIPVVAVFDADFREIARFVERPPEVNRWLSDNLGNRKWNQLSPDEKAVWKPAFLAKGREFRAEAVNRLVRTVDNAKAGIEATT